MFVSASENRLEMFDEISEMPATQVLTYLDYSAGLKAIQARALKRMK